MKESEGHFLTWWQFGLIFLSLMVLALCLLMSSIWALEKRWVRKQKESRQKRSESPYGNKTR